MRVIIRASSNWPTGIAGPWGWLLALMGAWGLGWLVGAGIMTWLGMEGL